MSNPAETIIHAHETIKRRVEQALHTQLGDRAQLQEHRRDALQLLQSFEQVCPTTSGTVRLLS